ncbi:MAG: 16S rRNA (guanine(527)-N(7))-methyltransferase RsmG [Hyphomicrobiaceae bacterium]|nr:16S rRNA (guanine(527)-N(7))-methyltransferase RsmG [Hyphomicrobiaceae bacterium]
MTPDEFQTLFDVSRETLGRLETYAALLRQWQKTINLVAPKTLDDLWLRHFADSAQLVRLVPTSTRQLVDLGSGGGFPGLVLAILLAEREPPAAQPVKVLLIESDLRKSAFLREVARQTRIAVDIMSSRIESITNSDSVDSADVITSRALAPLPRLLALSSPLWGQDTTGLFLKGRTAEQEVAEAHRDWSFEYVLEPSMTERDARIVMIRKLKRKKEG